MSGRIERLLSSLDKVKATGRDKWVARCPAHSDRAPSLAIKQTDDGRILLHDFGGCETEDVLSALGMTFTDIMQERLTDTHMKPERWLNAHDALATLDHEALMVAIIGADFLEHKKIEPDTWARLAAAVNRINDTRAKFARCRK